MHYISITDWEKNSHMFHISDNSLEQQKLLSGYFRTFWFQPFPSADTLCVPSLSTNGNIKNAGIMSYVVFIVQNHYGGEISQ